LQAIESAIPLHLSFTGSVRVRVEHCPPFRPRSASRTGFFFSWLMTELAERRISPRPGRSHPRVVKKPRQNSPLEKPPIREAEPFNLSFIAQSEYRPEPYLNSLEILLLKYLRSMIPRKSQGNQSRLQTLPFWDEACTSNDDYWCNTDILSREYCVIRKCT